MNPFLIIIFLFGLILHGCGNKIAESSQKNFRESFKESGISAAIPEPLPLMIKPEALLFRELTIADPTDAEMVLNALFPGRIVGDEGVSASLWACADCEATGFTGWNSGDQKVFPHPGGMETMVTRSFRYTEQQRELTAVFFTSQQYDPSKEGMGRFDCGILGAALFELKDDQWVLTAFAPSVDCTGSWSVSAIPDTVRGNGGSMNFFVINKNGGPGSASAGDYILYRFAGNTFTRMLVVEDGYLSGSQTSWQTRFSFGASKEDGLIVAVIEGSYDSSDMEELSEISFGEPFTTILAKKEYSRFNIIRTYSMKGGKYTMENNDLRFTN